MTSMKSGEPASIRTRPSLLNRLKTGDDKESWQTFYHIYGKLVRDFAIRAGLTDTEADEVVQETAIAVARHLPEFRYDPKVCKFRTWLLNQCSWRIKDQFKKRRRAEQPFGRPGTPGSRALSKDALAPNDDTRKTDIVERVPDPNVVDFGVLFETEWRHQLFAVAMDRLQSKFTLKQIQMFDLHAVKDWPASDVARSLGVSVANVYVTKHRVSGALKKEMTKLEAELEQALRRGDVGENESNRCARDERRG